MSHFTKIKTEMTRKRCLLEALKDLGYEPREDRSRIGGYGGRQTDVDIVVPTSSSAYQIGFRKDGEFYEIVADWHGIPHVDAEAFPGRLRQRYAYHAVLEDMSEKGFEVDRETLEESGAIRLVVRRGN